VDKVTVRSSATGAPAETNSVATPYFKQKLSLILFFFKNPTTTLRTDKIKKMVRLE
jgi:hypothetical protein